MRNSQLARPAARILAVICLIISIPATIYWIRSVWKIDLWTFESFVAISCDQDLVIGESDKAAGSFSHEAGPTTKGRIDGWLWLIFQGDVEPDNCFGFDQFIVSWRQSSSPYWFVVVPLWPVAISTGLFPLFALVARWLPHSNSPPGRARNYLWLLLYLPSLVLLVFALMLPDPFGFGSPGSELRDKLIRGSIYWFGAILIAYIWRLARWCTPLGFVTRRGFEVLPADTQAAARLY